MNIRQREGLKYFIKYSSKEYVIFCSKGKTMCQMKIMMDKEGQQELVMEDVANLEVVEEGIMISTLFEETKLIPGVAIKTIDFLSGKAMLQDK